MSAWPLRISESTASSYGGGVRARKPSRQGEHRAVRPHGAGSTVRPIRAVHVEARDSPPRPEVIDDGELPRSGIDPQQHHPPGESAASGENDPVTGRLQRDPVRNRLRIELELVDQSGMTRIGQVEHEDGTGVVDRLDPKPTEVDGKAALLVGLAVPGERVDVLHSGIAGGYIGDEVQAAVEGADDQSPAVVQKTGSAG